MKAITCRLVSAAGYLMNVCMMTRNDLENLDKIVKNILKNEGFHEQLCTKIKTVVEGCGVLLTYTRRLK